MKKTLLILSLSTMVCALSAYGQGNINFSAILSGVVSAHIYGPESINTTILQGNTAAETPAGTQVYNATFRVQGTGYTAQLWGGPSGIGVDNFVAQTPTTTFRTATAGTGGVLNAVNVSFSNVSAAPADMLVRVWDNKGGTITSWSQVLADNLILRGESNPFTVALTLPPAAAAPALVGMQSFNIHTAVPEPSAIALGVLGVGALVLFRRRKN